MIYFKFAQYGLVSCSERQRDQHLHFPTPLFPLPDIISYMIFFIFYIT